jgi:hypothetical protein
LLGNYLIVWPSEVYDAFDELLGEEDTFRDM